MDTTRVGRGGGAGRRGASARPSRGARVAVVAVAAAAALLAAGCADNGGRPDGGGGDGGDGTCTALGRIYCSGNTALRCDATGHSTRLAACGAGQVCADGIGCAACMPGARRCEPGTGVPQACNADGTAYAATGPACDPATGRTCIDGMCQNPCEAAASARSYIGCEYWPVTTRNTCLAEAGGDFPFAIAVANGNSGMVTVTVEGGALGAPVMRPIAPGTLEVIELPWVPELAQLRQRTAGSVLRRGGAYHVTATLPVTVYQFNSLNFQIGMTYSYSNDASLLLPTPVLGNQYTALVWPGLTIMNGAEAPWASGGTITVVGTSSASTHVSVRVAGSTIAGMSAGATTMGVPALAANATSEYDLARGDVLELVGAGMGSDLSGSRVTANNPVAVHTGHGCARVPAARQAGDHLEEQALPDNVLGRRYAVSAFIDRPTVPSVVRIMAVQDGTTLTFDPPGVMPAPAPLGAGAFVEFETTSNFVVSANHPIAVAQFMYGMGDDGTTGDPAMVYEVPVEQYRTEYTFLTPQSYTRSFVNIVGPRGSAPVLDGAAVTVAGQQIGGSDLMVWPVEVMPGVHRLGDGGAAVAYGIKVYGVALFTSYAYPGGLDLRVIPPG